EGLAVDSADELDDGWTGSNGFQASTVTAIAKRSRFIQGRVADLTCRPGRASQQSAVDDDPGAYAGSRLDVGKVRAVPAGAPGELGQRAEVRVVLDLDRNLKALFHLCGDAKPNPTREHRCRAGGATPPSAQPPGSTRSSARDRWHVRYQPG